MGEVILFSSPFSFQFTFIESESFPTGIDTPNSFAKFEMAWTPLKRSPLSSEVFEELIQLAEKTIFLRESCFAPITFVRASAIHILTDASGFSMEIFGFSPIAKTWPE